MLAELVCSTLQLAIFPMQQSSGLIVHSNRGNQYGCQDFLDLLDRYGLLGCMSRKGNCWDTVIERFFLNVKLDRVWRRYYAHHQEAIVDERDYIV
jgi:transposase InsO family protein